MRSQFTPSDGAQTWGCCFTVCAHLTQKFIWPVRADGRHDGAVVTAAHTHGRTIDACRQDSVRVENTAQLRKCRGSQSSYIKPTCPDRSRVRSLRLCILRRTDVLRNTECACVNSPSSTPNRKRCFLTK